MSQAPQQPPAVALVLRGSASRFPPTIHQANLLAEQGYRVSVLETALPGGAESSPVDARVEHCLVGHSGDFNHSAPSAWQRWQSRQRFQQEVRAALKTLRPRVVVAYDSDSLMAIRPWVGRPAVLSIAHWHELPEVTGRQPLAHYRLGQAVQVAQACSLTVHPDPLRAAMYMATWGIRTEPLVVYNCPRRIAELTPLPLMPGGPPQRHVLYQGVIAASRGLGPVLQSLAEWPADTALVLRGIVVESFAQELQAEARTLGVADRVHFLHQPAYRATTIATTASALAGIGLYQTRVGLGTHFSAFASNKIFEYIAAGVPVLAPDGAGYRELVALHGLGLCVDAQDPHAIAGAIRRLAGDSAYRQSMSARARQLHLQSLNYDEQFRPVLEKIARHLATTASLS